MKIAVLGAGNMGLAFASAFVVKKLAQPSDLLLIEPRKEAHADLKAQGFQNILESVTAQITDVQLLILAVKPQDFIVLAGQIRPFIRPDQIVLSIMAGMNISKIKSLLGVHKIVRSMPNTPAKLGLGVTGYVTQELNAPEEKWIESLLNSTGSAIKFSDENLMDTVTAISGSGPAYFYYFLKSIVEAGKQLGMEERMAKKLASETMLGAYHLVKNSDADFDELINAVKSKGGTTEAALNTFEDNKVGLYITEGVINAEKRAKELSKNV